MRQAVPMCDDVQSFALTGNEGTLLEHHPEFSIAIRNLLFVYGGSPKQVPFLLQAPGPPSPATA